MPRTITTQNCSEYGNIRVVIDGEEISNGLLTEVNEEGYVKFIECRWSNTRPGNAIIKEVKQWAQEYLYVDSSIEGRIYYPSLRKFNANE